MAKAAANEVDVLVVGQHPAAYLAVRLLREAAALRVTHALGAGGVGGADRLTLINPDFFSLAPGLGKLKEEVELAEVWGIEYLGEQAGVRSESAGKMVAAYVGSFKQIHDGLAKLAGQAGGEKVAGSAPIAGAVQVHAVDELGVAVRVGRRQLRARLMILSDGFGAEVRTALGVPEQWDAEVLHYYTFVKLRGEHGGERGMDGKKAGLVPMSLDLGGTMSWGWLLSGVSRAQVAVLQTAEAAGKTLPREQLKRWAAILEMHGVVKIAAAELEGAQTLELPLAGALVQEAVANRALLIGPAGGFISACGEDVYPGCWSAVMAAEAAREALGQVHVQDALRAYRQRWGATIGDYLRGPQQNLRFLLPLVYRNPMMAARLREAILLGKSVVR
jgi:hypothetical protein